MSRSVDNQVLEGFIEEARSYIPLILDCINLLEAHPSETETLEEAYRHIHTIKGASAMVGLAGLSHMAYHIEELMEEIADGQVAVKDDTAANLREAVTFIEEYLEEVSSETLDERYLVAEVLQIYRRVKGLPEEDDESALGEAMMSLETATVGVTDKENLSVDLPAAHEDRYEDTSPELLEVFALEAEDHLRNIITQLSTLEKEPENKELLQEVRRSVHTLKGAAGAVGLQDIVRLTHRMEDLLEYLFDDSLVLNAGTVDILYKSTDALEDLSTGEVDENVLRATIQELYDGYSDLLGNLDHEEERLRGTELLDGEGIIDLTKITFPAHERTSSIPMEKGMAPVARKPGEVVRVPLERLDDLVRLVSELVIGRTAFEQRMTKFIREVDELQLSSDRLRRVSTNIESNYEVSALGGKLSIHQAPSVLNPGGTIESAVTQDFDELEFDRYTEFHLLSRELIETTSDIRTVGNELVTMIGDFDSILNRQGRISSEIQNKLMRTRMVPLATLATRLHRAVRVLAREQGKMVELVLEGEEIELDKTVLDEMADPLLHLLRNAVDHGIEPPELRQVMGKTERGKIVLRAFHEGNQVVIQVSDDGTGLEPQILQSAAIRGGHVSDVDATQLPVDDLYSLIFLPGFSTAGEVSEISGRGVGLDIVKTNVHRLKGTVSVASTPGKGTDFVIRLPMTLAIMRALLVKAHNETFAVPLGVVTNILRLERDEIELVGREPVIRLEHRVYPLLRLGEVLDLKQPADETEHRLPVLILDVGTQQVALVVDQLIGGREIVIKTLGSHLRKVHGVAGATLMGDGSVVLILNPSELVVDAPAEDVVQKTSHPTALTSTHDALAVMIVDDSISVRRVVSNLIKGVGWVPITAKDGIEALEIIQRSTKMPDLMLVDIEMPRMDGYELMSTIKAQDAYQHIPLVVLTSRAGKKHRRKALETGASEYIVKPYQDDVLISVIRRLVSEKRRAVIE
jgi:chemosensory pili system protein ChpA (sensor histidine kinase/response regulator)